MHRFCLLIALICWSITAAAHHAAAGRYDPDLLGEVSGEITETFWRNPHVRFMVAVEGDDGATVEWEIEFGSLNTIQRIGVTRDVVAVGDRISVHGIMGRGGLPVMFAEAVTLTDGTVVALQADVRERYGLTDDAMRDAGSEDIGLRQDIFRVWLPLLRPDTGAGNTEYALTDAARAAQAAWDPEDDPALRCIPPGMPTIMDNPYPIEFVDQGDVITMRIEEWDGERTIYINGEGDPVQPHMGRSVGSWDGQTLEVETTDIDWNYIDDLGTPMSDDVVINEQYTLSDDGTELDWVMHITDPVNFPEPVVKEATWTWVPGHEIKPFDCALPEQG